MSDKKDSYREADDTAGVDVLSGTTTALEDRLRTYYAARADQAPDVEAIWQRLGPHMRQPVRPSPPLIRGLRSQDRARPLAASEVQRPAKRGWAGRTLSYIGPLAAVLLIALTTVALLHQRGLAQTRPGGTTRQNGDLLWRQVRLPAGVVLAGATGVTEARVVLAGATGVTEVGSGSGPTPTTTTSTPNSSWQVAQENGDVAYLCELLANTNPHVWRTSDAGQHWTQLQDIPTRGTYSACTLEIDGNDQNTVVANLTIGPEGAALTQTFALFDGADGWQRLNQPVGAFSSDAEGLYFTVRNMSYPGATSPRRTSAEIVGEGQLLVSYDQMQSWMERDAPLLAESVAAAVRLKQGGDVGVTDIWVHPYGTELLARTADGVLWHSMDAGTTWQQIALPVLPKTLPTLAPGVTEWDAGSLYDTFGVVVQHPNASAPFALCAVVLDQQTEILNEAPFYCSTDSGQTWVRRPQPAAMLPNGKGPQFEKPGVMLADGMILAWDVRAIFLLPGNTTGAQVGYQVGTTPTPRDPNDIPVGQLGVSAHGATLWQPIDPKTLFVTQYVPK